MRSPASNPPEIRAVRTQQRCPIRTSLLFAGLFVGTLSIAACSGQHATKTSVAPASSASGDQTTSSDTGSSTAVTGTPASAIGSLTASPTTGSSTASGAASATTAAGCTASSFSLTISTNPPHSDQGGRDSLRLAVRNGGSISCTLQFPQIRFLSSSGSTVGPASTPYLGASSAATTFAPGQTYYTWYIDYPAVCAGQPSATTLALTSSGLDGTLNIPVTQTPCTPQVGAWQTNTDFPS